MCDRQRVTRERGGGRACFEFDAGGGLLIREHLNVIMLVSADDVLMRLE
jgi:hypothetical protein